MTGTVLVDVAEDVATLTLNRPERRNAVSWDLVVDLVDALEKCRRLPVRALVLTGAGGNFCVGADMHRVGSGDRDDHETRTLLGIPFAPTMALVLAALLMNGIVPGPTFVDDQPEIFWTVIAAMYIGNAMLLVLNLPLVGLFTRLLAMPPQTLMPFVIGLCIVGVYAENNSMFDVWVMLAVGVLGFLLRRSGFSMAAFVLAVVLQPTLETSLRQTLAYSSGDPTYVLGRPFTVVVLGLVLVALVLAARRALARRSVTSSAVGPT